MTLIPVHSRGGQEGYSTIRVGITSLVLLQGATATCLHRGCHDDAQAGINGYNAILPLSLAEILQMPNAAFGKPALDALWASGDILTPCPAPHCKASPLTSP